MSGVCSEEVRPRLRLHVFGAMQASCQTGESVLPRGRKAQGILAYLAMCGEPTVSRRRLTGLLWSTRWEEQARASLRQSLFELRRSIGAISPELLCIENDRVTLQTGKVWIEGIGLSNELHRLACSPRQDPSVFLETLRGLDQAFDRWIDMRIATFTRSNKFVCAWAWCNCPHRRGRELVRGPSNSRTTIYAADFAQVSERR
ncbi:hypothetical protein AYJ54_17765 [Bradyrhizobium centrolobii]|uniref:OmpR/PhoB-type domain-containing protein n=2 Tax=Bradyrhizobium TaxID=374 RepID=A0A176ZGM7_9BRAD|nr:MULTISPECIES: hypothetical protein [Bradyrhizobium]OAF07410.1 hypothetical protein AYJ54_17765 [Bradyrhizobium centrolobii]OAF19728.1 hypothetical protein AXW67_35840 [Bradyrhizobium neotropicale]